jgi:hypothetical protein
MDWRGGEGMENDRKPGSTRAMFIVLGLGIVVLAFVFCLYMWRQPDKDIALIAVNSVSVLVVGAGGYAFGRLQQP